MPRLLVINPNTSTQVSTSIDILVRDVTASAAEVRTMTADFGFSYISTRVAVSIAAHAVLDAAARAIAESGMPDAILLACFGDPGREALAEMTGLPVIGFAEAGLLAAADMPGTSLIATNGAVWCEMLAELVLKLGIQEKVAAIRSIETVAESPRAIAEFLDGEAARLGAAHVVLGGAGLIPWLAEITQLCRVPILDPHREAIAKAMRLSDLSRPITLKTTGSANTFGLSPSLTAMLGGGTDSGHRHAAC